LLVVRAADVGLVRLGRERPFLGIEEVA